uniref:Uncharacterized protein n=1 Tax=Dromaius novaehollandiae TaxID=8790 RepID=A0A8C4KUR3_DRONO
MGLMIRQDQGQTVTQDWPGQHIPLCLLVKLYQFLAHQTNSSCNKAVLKIHHELYFPPRRAGNRPQPRDASLHNESNQPETRCRRNTGTLVQQRCGESHHHTPPPTAHTLSAQGRSSPAFWLHAARKQAVFTFYRSRGGQRLLNSKPA